MRPAAVAMMDQARARARDGKVAIPERVFDHDLIEGWIDRLAHKYTHLDALGFLVRCPHSSGRTEDMTIAACHPILSCPECMPTLMDLFNENGRCDRCGAEDEPLFRGTFNIHRLGMVATICPSACSH